MSGAANQLVAQEREDVGRGIRLLLAHPLITARGRPEDFDLVRRRRQLIDRWFEHYCGWQLQVEPRAGYARLVKVRAPDPTRPARRLRSTRAPFDRRRYTLLCVLAAELLSGPITTIGLLADRVVQATSVDPVLPAFDPASRAERKAFVDALRLLEHYGVLDVLDGVSESYVEHADAKVLYRADATLLMRMLAAPVPPSLVDGQLENFDGWLAGLLRERRAGTAASKVQEDRWLRHSVLRRLVDDPVLYLDDLTDAQRQWLDSPAGRQVVRQACEQAGFELEERAEGYLAVDPDAIATDGRFPDDSNNAKVAALLMLDAITTAPADGPSRPRSVPVARLEAEAQRLLQRFPNWAKAYRSTDGARRLAQDALAVLCSFGLVRVDAPAGGPGNGAGGPGNGAGGFVDGHQGVLLVRPLPAAARYRPNTSAADGDPP